MRFHAYKRFHAYGHENMCVRDFWNINQQVPILDPEGNDEFFGGGVGMVNIMFGQLIMVQWRT